MVVLKVSWCGIIGRAALLAAGAAASVNAADGPGPHCMIQPLVELYGDCMVVLKVSWCGIRSGPARGGEAPQRFP